MNKLLVIILLIVVSTILIFTGCSSTPSHEDFEIELSMDEKGRVVYQVSTEWNRPITYFKLTARDADDVLYSFELRDGMTEVSGFYLRSEWDTLQKNGYTYVKDIEEAKNLTYEKMHIEFEDGYKFVHTYETDTTLYTKMEE